MEVAESIKSYPQLQNPQLLHRFCAMASSETEALVEALRAAVLGGPPDTKRLILATYRIMLENQVEKNMVNAMEATICVLRTRV